MLNIVSDFMRKFGGIISSGLSGGNLSFSGSDARSVGLGRASSASAADFAQFAMQLNRSASASTADFEAAFKGLSMSDMEEAIAAREGKEMKQKQQQQLQQQQEQQQHRQRAQIAAQVQAQAQVAQSAQVSCTYLRLCFAIMLDWSDIQ